jgi:uncharacterized radical SAM superfamily Fe-S cluster-containing enzyme
MEKKCVAHGTFKELISPDSDFYMRLFTIRYGDGRGYSNPLITNAKICPEDCGICNMHHSQTCMANIDLASYEQVVEMMKVLRNRKPVPVKVVQFSSGEPACHLRFLDIVRKAKEMGFSHIQAAHNEKNMSDLNFARAAAEAGLHTIYLQKDALELKMKTVEVCREAGLKIVLAPAIIKGVNDDQVGEIVKFACENADVITGVCFQPACFTGKISENDRLNKRYTITHLAKDLAAQTDNLMPLENWFPIAATEPLSRLSEAMTGKAAFMISCHPDCGAGGYLFVEPKDKKEIKPLASFFDLEKALVQIQTIAEKITARKNSWWNKQASRLGLAKTTASWRKLRALKAIRKYFNSSKAPAGLTFSKLLGVVDGYRDTKAKSYNTVFVAAMHFQDVYNYDIERVKRCVIHHAATDGKIYPFCSFNSGPYHRAKIQA